MTSDYVDVEASTADREVSSLSAVSVAGTGVTAASAHVHDDVDDRERSPGTTSVVIATVEHIKAHWPPAVSVEMACRAIGISKSHGYELIKTNRFPCRVIQAGTRSRVVTASLVALLEES